MIRSAVRNSIRGAGRQAYPHQVARALPRAGLLLYLGRPNLEAADVPLGDDTEIGDDTIIRWMFLLPADADIRAATGWISGTGNIFYDAAGDPVAVFASEIAAWSSINQWNVLFHLVSADTETGRLAIYDPSTVSLITLARAYKALRSAQNASGVIHTTPFIDQIGANTRPLYGLQYLHLAEATDFINASIIGTETVTSQPADTAAITVAAGKLTIAAGDLWSWAVDFGGTDNISTYEFGTILTATTGVVFDTSGHGRHLLFSATDTHSVCVSGREKGSDCLDTKGWSNRGNLLKYSELITNSLWVLVTNSGVGLKTADLVRMQNTPAGSDSLYQTQIPMEAGDYVIGFDLEALGRGALQLQIFPDRPLDTNGSGIFPLQSSKRKMQYHPFTLTTTANRHFYINASQYDSVYPVDFKFHAAHLCKDVVPTDNGKIVVTGHSIAKACVPVIAKFLRTSMIVDKCIAGSGLATIKNNFASAVVAESPSKVLIFGAINSILNASTSPIASMQSDLEYMCNLADDNNINVSIPTECACGGHASWSSQKQIWIDDWNSYVLALTSSRGYSTVDLYNISKDIDSYRLEQTISSDDLHLTGPGYYCIVSEIVDKCFVREWPDSKYIATTESAIYDTLQPLQLNSDTVDVFGQAIQYPGQAKLNIIPISNPSDTTLTPAHTYSLADSHQIRTALGWVWGTDHWAFTDVGVPKVIAGEILLTNGVGPNIWANANQVTILA